MNYTGILIVLLLLAFVVIAVMFYEIMEYEKDKKIMVEKIDKQKDVKKRWTKEKRKVKTEYRKLYETAKQLQESDKSRNRRVIQNVINDIEVELKGLNDITTGLEGHDRRQDLKATNKILTERLNYDKPTKANS